MNGQNLRGGEVNKLKQWQQRHNISTEAMNELSDTLGLSISVSDFNFIKHPAKSEAAVSSDCRLKASRQLNRLWRNNVGVAFREDGVPIRFGLCNETAKMNKMVKSSDLIGIKQVLITQAMVGTIIGQFWAPEIKKADWFYTGTESELAQLKFHQIVNDLHGCAKFVNDVDKL